MLNQDLCWEERQLHQQDPATGHYLLTLDETDEARVNAEVQRDAAQARVRELEAELQRWQEVLQPTPRAD